MTNHQTQIEQAVSAIEAGAKKHEGFSAFHHELNALRTSESASKYATDLSQITKALEAAHILPNLDIVATGIW
jgi:hypothetical protein